MPPESALESNCAEDERSRRTGRHVRLALGVLLLIVVLGAVPAFLLLGGPESRLGRTLGFGVEGPIVTTRSPAIGPIELQRSAALVKAGIKVEYVGSSSISRGSILGHTETRGFTVRVTAANEPIEPEELTFQVIDDQDKVIGEGIVQLPAKLDPGEGAVGKVDVPLQDSDGNPAKLIIGRKKE